MQIPVLCKPAAHAHGDRWSVLTKTILVMKLSAILILVTALHVAARSTAQRVTFSANKVELSAVFSIIREQTGYVFFYDKEYLKGLNPVTVSLKDAPLQDAMTAVLRDMPLEFEMQGNTIFISRKVLASAPSSVSYPLALKDTIRGVVLDSAGAPLAGASVVIKGSSHGTKTDLSGSFRLPDAGKSAVLLVSYTGYEDKVVVAEAHMFLAILMKRSENPLDEIVIQAYGTTSRRFNVGSISTVTAETIEKQPVTNVLLALQGQAPGLAITATSGVPGSSVLVQVRGQNTIQTTPNFTVKPYDQPLLIIDGVPFATQNNVINQLSSLANAQQFSGGISSSGGISPLNNINPVDIESISILKDADATSIYGTQGSNGVILITTKKGKVGNTTFNLTANTGFNSAARPVKFLNTQQYLQYRKDAFAADSADFTTNPLAPDLNVFDQDKYTDWSKVIYGKTSNVTDLHGSLSGGAYNNTFILSAGYTRSNYNYPGNFLDQRLSLHGHLHHSSTDNRLTVDFGTDFGYDQNNSPGFGGLRSVLLPPNTPDLLDSSGNLLWSYKGVDLANYQFYGYLKQPTNLQNYNMNNSLQLAYRIIPGLTFTTNLGYNRNTTSEHSQSPASAQSPLYAQAKANFADRTAQTINIEPQLDYNFNTGKHMFAALIGGTYKKNLAVANNISATGYANDNFLGSVNGAANIYSYDQFNIYKYSAGFARLKYTYDQKYIISLTGRRDGSSNFGPGNQFGNFGSVGAGWIFSEEKLLKYSVRFLSFGKLSASYGTSGSDGIAAYQYQAFWQPLYYVPAFQGVQPSVPSNLYNPNYSWALKKSLNVAMDLGFWQDRLLVNVTYYRNREGNQLGAYPLPSQVGFNSVVQNLPASIQNKGWEIGFTSTNVKTKSFNWSSNFNISFNRNKLLDFPNLDVSPYRTTYLIGQPTSLVFGYKYAGVDPASGLMQYYTKDGKLTTTPTYGIASSGGDYVPIANREVKFMGGFGNNLTFHRFSLYLFFQFSSQMAPNYLSTVYSYSFPSLNPVNIPEAALDYWKKPGDKTTLQKLTSSYGTPAYQAASNFNSSSGAYSNDTYLRLKAASLSYALPERWLHKMRMKDLRLYMNVQNLLTITNYKVADPEQFNDYTAVPVQRTVVFGLNFNF